MDFTLEGLINDNRFQILISLTLAFLVTWRSIPVLIDICRIRGLMENPIKRSSHASPTPTFGGVAIFAGTLIGYMIWNFKDEEFLLHKVIAGLLILFFLGLKDDLYALAPLKKIGSQVLASLLVVVGSDLRINSFFGIFGVHELNYYVSVVFTVFLFVALINSFNLIDGIDGLAGGIGMIASGAFGLWFSFNEHWSLACMSLSLSASLLGFLRYNFSKVRKIFMGDTGSLIIGYLITVFAVKFVHLNQYYNFSPGENYVSAPVIAIAILCVPIFDTLRVFGLRTLKGRSPFHADRLHLHHLLVDNGMSHMGASFTLYTMTIVLSLFTFFLRTFFTNTALSVYVIGVFGVYLIMCNYLEIRRFRVKKEKLQATKNPRAGGINFKSSINPN